MKATIRASSLLTSVFLALVPGICHAERFNWGFSPTDPEPYVITHNNSLTDGLTHGIGTLVAAHLGWEVTFVATPNARVDDAMRTGRIDLICNTQPAWHEPAEEYLWTTPLYEDADIIVTSTNSPAPDGLKALHGSIVGASLGYHYADELSQAFTSGAIVRRDVRDLGTRLRMIERGRLHASVDLRRAVRFHVRQQGLQSVRISNWTVEEMALSCAIAKLDKTKANSLAEAIEALLEQQRVQEVVRRFD